MVQKMHFENEQQSIQSPINLKQSDEPVTEHDVLVENVDVESQCITSCINADSPHMDADFLFPGEDLVDSPGSNYEDKICTTEVKKDTEPCIQY